VVHVAVSSVMQTLPPDRPALRWWVTARSAHFGPALLAPLIPRPQHRGFLFEDGGHDDRADNPGCQYGINKVDEFNGHGVDVQYSQAFERGLLALTQA
jgi:hypothetical protein